MEKVTLKMLVLAAATVAPQMAKPHVEPAQAKRAEQMSKDELRGAERPTVYTASRFEKKRPLS